MQLVPDCTVQVMVMSRLAQAPYLQGLQQGTAVVQDTYCVALPPEPVCPVECGVDIHLTAIVCLQVGFKLINCMEDSYYSKFGFIQYSTIYYKQVLLYVLINIHVLAAQCFRLTDPSHGTVRFTSNTRPVGSRAVYTCDFRYYLVGTSTRTCQSSGSWSGSPPYCRGDHNTFLQTRPGFHTGGGGWNWTSHTVFPLPEIMCDRVLNLTSDSKGTTWSKLLSLLSEPCPKEAHSPCFQISNFQVGLYPYDHLHTHCQVNRDDIF